MSLERRANSGGNSGGSGTPSPPDLPLAKLKTQSALSLAKMILTVENYLLRSTESEMIKPSLKQTAARLTAKIQAGLIEAMKSVSNILKKIGRVGENMETTHISLRDIFQSYRTFFEELIPIFLKFPSGKAYHGYLFDICKSLDKLLADQEGIYGKFAKAF
ncbi:hypothetical protein BASA60_004363 [Batrachochytrium salamandrivorans]|nr:hypothetical protein BASA60_004363 [Batrachochytrium salamandrivorans]